MLYIMYNSQPGLTVVDQVDETHRPVLVTNRGRGVAVVQALADHEAESEERGFRTRISLCRTDAREPKWFVETQVKKPHALYRRQ